MIVRHFHFLAILLLAVAGPASADPAAESREILVTFDNSGIKSAPAGMRAPYRNRKRYAISVAARDQARAVEKEYDLIPIEHWPINSLAVYCFVYQIADNDTLELVIDELRADDRIESVQPKNTFETGITPSGHYDDTFANLQHGVVALDLQAAHRLSQGRDVRITIVDSGIDIDHEDLVGQVVNVLDFSRPEKAVDQSHGTAVTSIIGARANNALGIVGVAPEAHIDHFVACWAEPGKDSAVCDSFTLAKALDAVLQDPPDVLNLSLNGPSDALLGRLLAEIHRRGTITVAAAGTATFPSDLATVIAANSSHDHPLRRNVSTLQTAKIYAPGEQILVAVPRNEYDFRSGSSLATAHVSGVIALVLAVAPELRLDTMKKFLQQSQQAGTTDYVSINACHALGLAESTLSCNSQ